jgi:hypothetical protein
VGGCPFVYGGINTSIYHVGINVVTGPPLGTLQGTVTNTFDGAPVVGATVTVPTYPPATTNAAGFYQITGITPGTVNVNATCTGYQPYNGTATLVAYQTTTKNFQMIPIPSYLTGTITNASTGGPVVGARISVGSTFTYSVANGYYYFQCWPSGLQPVIIQKAGFDTDNTPVNLIPGSTTTYNKAISVTANPPGTVTAILNGTSTAVDISWLPPSGSYEIIYDDGGKENFTVWAVAGNMNAVKFTPITGGVQINAGKVNIGDAANYAAGTDPLLLAPFQIAVYDATGPGGVPGAPIGSPIDVLPTSFGWNIFTFPTPISVTGNFYLVMIQGGAPPNAAGLAVDETTNKLRSYSRFVTGNGPWLPASGNYMIRAVVTGQGGPLDTDATASKTEITANPIEGLIYDHTPASVTGVEGNADYVPTVIPYTVWRLLEGQEGNEALWGAPIASNITGTSTVDNGWPSLPDGPYRWAVKAGYPVNRLSPPTFSNVIGKNWTAAVTVNVTLSCTVGAVAGTIVKLQNTAFSQYVYTATLTSTGTVTFPAVWKGTYDLTVSKIGYDTYLLPAQVIMGPMTFDVVLLQQRLAPSNMYVNPKSLMSIWNAPMGLGYPLLEDWSSGSFATNNWAYEANWAVYTGFGNPSPAAWFYYSPTLTNYTRSLTSKTLTGTGSPDFKLIFDIYLSNYSTSTLEELAVEYQIGGAGPWVLLKHYDNTAGSINWTTETLNMASVGAQNFKIRFRAYGVNSYNINYWVVDNIKVRSVAPDPKPCILAYYVYLGSAIVGVTTSGSDTTFQIPPYLVNYGQPYTACVRAIYGSGYSAPSCDDFISTFLYPPTNLEVEVVECAAYLTWEKPGTKKILSVTERTSFPNPSIDYAPYIYTMSDPGNGDNSDAIWDVLFSWPCIPATGAGAAQVGVEVDGNYLYTSDWGGPNGGPPWFAKYDLTTGTLIEAFNITGATAIRDLAFDGTYFYGSPYSTSIYKMDFTTKTLVGTIPTSYAIRHIAYDPVNNGFWIGDWYTMYLVNATTGALIATGPAMSSAYGSAYDADPAGPFLWVHQQNGSPLDEVVQYKITGTTLTATGITHNMGYVPGFPSGGIAGGLCAADVGTKFALIGATQGSPNQVWAVELRAGGGPPPGGVGLLGYKIYRDGPQVHYVGDPDTLFWYDFTVEPGTHSYAVSAWYELTAYGFPGMTDESMLEGPVVVDIMCGRELPFYEPWDQGSFAYNDWTLDSLALVNWSVSSSVGNPVPSADFSWVPIQYNYSLSLETPVLNGGPFTCAMIWCDFDYKLADRNSTGDEKLFVDVFFKGSWKNKAEFSNTASKDWTPMHIDITAAKGKAFKVRFRAEGVNSADILHWYVDNVHIYAKCNPPIGLSDPPEIADRQVTLTWSAPECGTEGPEPIWIHWDDGTNFTSIGTGGAVEFDIAARWDAAQIVALDGGAVTKIAFYPASAGVATYKIRVWEGPDAATLLVDQAVPTVTLDDWNIVDVASPAPIDISKELWVGVNVNASGGWPAGCDAGPEVDGYGNMMYYMGAWATLISLNPSLTYNWNIQGYVEPADDHATTKKVIPLVQNMNYKSGGTLSSSGLPSLNPVKFSPVDNGTTEGRALLGYNIYRSDDNKLTYNKLNASMLTDTNYVDVVPNYQEYWYYVTSIFPSYGSLTCESDSSNVILADVIIGIDQLNGGGISIYPNPATDHVIVKSDFTITNVEVLNYIGQTVYTRQNVSEKTLKVNVVNLTAGVYFMKVTTVEGIKTVKITVTR